MGKNKDAAAAFNKAIELDPGLAGILNNSVRRIR
jgi:hypothetical protein